MAVQFFAPKTLGSVTLGAGVLTGGGTIYWYQMPRTWKELLVKEGFLFLSTEDDYKGMWNDQNENSDKTSATGLSDANENNIKNKAESYCKTELVKDLPASSDSSYESTKSKLIAFCTSGGIKTVKARLIQSKKTGWIKQENEDDKWKTMFAIYRYDSRFIEWLKEDSKDSSLNEKTKVSEGWDKLKTACTNLLAKSYKDLTDDKYFEYGSWWCIDLGYTTVKERAKKDSSWEEETDGKKIEKRWKTTDNVTQKIKEDLNKGEDDTLADSDYKKWCEQQLKKELKTEEYYKNKYIMIKSVCKKAK